MFQAPGQRPRDYYGPRRLLPECYGRRATARAYGKKRDSDRGIEALPAERAVVCPNRIAERRVQSGFDSTRALANALRSISYQRLRRIETGRAIVRESELTLIAGCLDLDVSELKLPLLTESETIEWNRRWGPEKQVEDGGDHDSVLLSAYVRHLVAMTGHNRTRLAKMMKAPGSCLSAIWYAEKPIDRYPDTTMALILQLAKTESWDQVIVRSQAMYASGELAAYIDQVKEPRLRYAPEDPDRKAPWTYKIAPDMPHRKRHWVKTPFSAEPEAMLATERRKVAKQNLVNQRRVVAEERCRTIIERAREGDVAERLFEMFPRDRLGVEGLLGNEGLARSFLARAEIVRGCRSSQDIRAAATTLGRSPERIRQLMRLTDEGQVAVLGTGRSVMLAELAI